MSKYVFSDLHGRYDLWLKIKNYLKEDDEVYCLGDCIDRGPAGAEIITEVMQDERITFINGNHEILMFDYYKKGGWYNEANWYQNGGDSTYESFKDKSQDLVYVLEEIKKAPDEIIIYNDNKQRVILNHCGYTPGKPYEPFWDRSHFYDEWPQYEECYKNTIIIHGHTPVQYLRYKFGFWEENSLYKPQWDYEDYILKDNPQVITYCNNHKIDIDMGSVFSDKAVLLNLDTFEPIYFTIGDGIDE